MAATLFSIGLLFASILLWLSSSRVSSYLDRIDTAFSGGQPRRLVNTFLLTLPMLAILVAALGYVLNPASPRESMIHGIFVLGAIVVAVLGTLMFSVPTRLKLDKPLPAALAAIIAAPMGVYFFPPDRYQQLFLPGQVNLGLTAGVFSLLVAELVLWSLRGKLGTHPVQDIAR